MRGFGPSQTFLERIGFVIVYGSFMNTNSAGPPSDRVIEAALCELTGYNGLLTHDGRDEAIQALRLLHQRGHVLSPVGDLHRSASEEGGR